MNNYSKEMKKMIILFVKLMMMYIVPLLSSLVKALTTPVLTIVILLVGISMLFSVVGVKFGTGMGAAFVNGVFRCLGAIGRACGRVAVRIYRWLAGLLPRVFSNVNRYLLRHSWHPAIAFISAAVVTVLVLVIII